MLPSCGFKSSMHQRDTTNSNPLTVGGSGRGPLGVYLTLLCSLQVGLHRYSLRNDLFFFFTYWPQYGDPWIRINNPGHSRLPTMSTPQNSEGNERCSVTTGQGSHKKMGVGAANKQLRHDDPYPCLSPHRGQDREAGLSVSKWEQCLGQRQRTPFADAGSIQKK